MEVLFLEPGPGLVRALLRPSRRLKEGEILTTAGGRIRLEERLDGGEWRISSDPEPSEVMRLAAQCHFLPYLKRDEERADRERYQTVLPSMRGL